MKRLIVTIASVIVCLALSSCAFSSKKKESGKQYDGYIYYLSESHLDLTREGFNYSNMTNEELAKDIAGRMVEAKNKKHDSALPDGVVIEKVTIEDYQVRVTLNSLFEKAGSLERTLCRAAIVKSFAQIPYTSGVMVFVGDNPLTAPDGTAYGLMTPDDFVFGKTFDEDREKTTLDLYFGDQNGEKLKKEAVPVKIGYDKSVAQAVVERLLEGPAFEGETALIPKNTQLISVSVMNDTAYVNFDNGFKDSNIEVSPELTVYSIVNSIIDNTQLTRVQIQIEGSTPVSYGGQIDLRHPLEANYTY